MNVITGTTVEMLKAEGKHREAGALAAKQGKPCYYGCHFGMRSTRNEAILDFRRGYFAAANAAGAR